MDIERFSEKLADPFLAHEHAHRYWWASQFVEGKTVLDIASGTGYGAAIMGRTAAKVFAIDLAAEAVHEAKERYSAPHLYFWQGDCTTFSVDEKVDIAVSFETFEHLTNEDQGRFLSRLTAALKEDGILVISTPNVREQHHERDYKNPFHLHEVDRTEFVQQLSVHFRHVHLLGQRIAPASFICPADEGVLKFEPAPSAVAIDHSRSLVEAPLSPTLPPVYLLAVASNKELPEVASSALMDNSFALAVASSATFRLREPASYFASLPERVAELEKHTPLLRDIGPSNLLHRVAALESELFRQIERISSVISDVEAQRTAQSTARARTEDELAQVKAALLEQQLLAQQLSNREAEIPQFRAPEGAEPLSLQLVKTLHVFEESLSSLRKELTDMKRPDKTGL